MKITLIGISNVGKTYWSKKLEKIGFKRFCCNDMIEKKLERELKNEGFEDIKDVAKWLGQPFERQHKKHSKKYLELEKVVVQEVLSKLRYYDSNHSNIVVDTTGSVIYLEDEILRTLKQLTTIVYLATSADEQEEMYQSYLSNPKPVIWGESFKRHNGESDMETLQLCYPKLLEYRTSHYKRIAHLTVESATIREAQFDTYQFLQMLSF